MQKPTGAHEIASVARRLDSRQRRWGAIGSVVLFLLIPIVFLVSASQLTKAKGPQWLPYTFENPYNYLFNSLLLLEGRAPYCIDHPGTTTQVFGALVLRLSSAESADDLVSRVLRDPEAYIRRLHAALLLLSFLVLWLCPWVTARALNSNVIGLLIQVPTLFFKTLLYYAILFGPDLMLVPFSVATLCCCTLLALPCPVQNKVVTIGVEDETFRHSSRQLRIPLIPALTGLLCALGIITKLTFMPLILISLFCCRNRKNLVTFIITFILALPFVLVPIYPRLEQFATWILNLGIHSERYGNGPVGLPQTNVYLASLSAFLHEEPIIAIIPIVTTATILVLWLLPKKAESSKPFSWRSALTIFVIQAIFFFVAAKESGIHYLIPLFVSTGLNLVFLFLTFQKVTQPPAGRVAGSLILLGLLALGVKALIERTPQTYAQLRFEKADQLRLYRHATQVAKRDVLVSYFFSDSPLYALCYGNNYAGGAFGKILSDMYPDALFFDVFNGNFQNFTQWISPEIILRKYDHLYFLGNPKFLPKVNGFEPDQFETIDQAGDYSLQKWIRK